MTTKPERTARRILQEMFQGVKVGYDRRVDKFTGVAILPDKVLDKALSDLADLILAERKPITQNNDDFDNGAESGFNRACEHLAKVFKGEK